MTSMYKGAIPAIPGGLGFYSSPMASALVGTCTSTIPSLVELVELSPW